MRRPVPNVCVNVVTDVAATAAVSLQVAATSVGKKGKELQSLQDEVDNLHTVISAKEAALMERHAKAAKAAEEVQSSELTVSKALPTLAGGCSVAFTSLLRSACYCGSSILVTAQLFFCWLSWLGVLPNHLLWFYYKL